MVRYISSTFNDELNTKDTTRKKHHYLEVVFSDFPASTMARITQRSIGEACVVIFRIGTG